MTFAGINFDDIHSNMGYHSKRLGIKDEYDIVLRNGDTLAIIETKYKVRDKDVTKLLGTKLSNFRLLYPEYDSYKIISGECSKWQKGRGVRKTNGLNFCICGIICLKTRTKTTA
jgi:uncharacterized Zn ribbon protein